MARLEPSSSSPEDCRRCNWKAGEIRRAAALAASSAVRRTAEGTDSRLFFLRIPTPLLLFSRLVVAGFGRRRLHPRLCRSWIPLHAHTGVWQGSTGSSVDTTLRLRQAARAVVVLARLFMAVGPSSLKAKLFFVNTNVL